MGKVRVRAGLIVAAGLLHGVGGGARAEELGTFGRVRITAVETEGAAQVRGVTAALAARFEPAAGRTMADVRIIFVGPKPDDPGLFDATIYDYATERGFDLVLDALGHEIGRRPLSSQPSVSPGELEDAKAIVSGASIWSGGLASGAQQLYEAMPPVTVGAGGRRLVNVGVIDQREDVHRPSLNEVVSVHIPTGEIVRHAAGAPDSSSAALAVCGPAVTNCGASVGSCAASYHVEWPAANPVWKFNVRHPSCTTSIQSEGTGLELTQVYLNDVLTLERAEMPILNVQYEGDTCGPYRDWLWQEDCFQATGVNAAPGIRVTTGNPTPTTFCESGTDAGNFRGVAIHDAGDALYLVTETTAGWYRYVIEWHLYLDGTIEPIIGFGAASNSCTCNHHAHHAYWRFEWALGGISGNASTGIATIERRQPGTAVYSPVTTEGKFYRPTTAPETDWWRIRNPQTGFGFILEPSPTDGDAVGDSYAKGDLWALAYQAGQINDPNPNTSINIDPWISGEALGTTKRLVTWYHATYDHDVGGGDTEPCEMTGPRFVPISECSSSVTLSKAVYGCSESVRIDLYDYDLHGAGSATAQTFSASEIQPETVKLTEVPKNSGHFRGAIPTSGGAAIHGDGLISVDNGDTLTVRYVDGSSCGTPNVNVVQTAAITCNWFGVSNVQVSAITPTGATVSWTTNGSSTSTVHYGTTPPGGSAGSGAGSVSSHSVILSGLAACTTYYYWVESTDAAGNTAQSNAGGGYFAFKTAVGTGTTQPTFNSTDTPKAIPDNNSTGATSTINVSDTRIVQDVDIKATLTHTYDEDLVLSVITPDNTTIVLANHRGDEGDNFSGTVFSDETGLPIASGAPPFPGSYKGEAALTPADGKSVAGAWKFKVVDSAGEDVGALVSWSLTPTLSSNCSTGGAGLPPEVPDGSPGSALRASRQTADGSAVHLNWDVGMCSSPNYHLLHGPLASVSTYALGGGVCGVGPLGSYTWTGVPSTNQWYVVVGDDVVVTEGSWGRNSSGAERKGTNASAQCGYTARVNTATCP